MEHRLQRFMTAPYQVTGQRSGVRPTTPDQKPLMGAHHEIPNCWVLNGLGSKGSSLAPWCAELLVDAMLNGKPIAPELDWRRGVKGSCS